MNKAIEFLQKIGTPAEVITSLESAEESTDLTELVSKTETHFTGFYKEKVKDEIHKASKGAAYNEMITSIRKQYGLTAQEVEGKKFDEVLKIADIKLTEKVGAKDAVEEINRMKQELIDKDNKIKEYDQVIIPNIISEKETEIAENQRKQLIVTELNNHKLIGATNYIIPAFTQDLLKQYKVSNDGVITDMNGAKVFDSQKKELSLTDVIIMEGKKAGIFAQSNGGEPAPSPTPAPVKKPAGQQSPNENKRTLMQNRIDEQKAKAGVK